MSVFFSWFIGNESERNKQITREPLRGSHDLLVPGSDSLPMNQEKKDTHSLKLDLYDKTTYK